MPNNHLSTTEVYGNWTMLAPDGTEMCRCGADRADWYLSRGLAEKVAEVPPTFKLKFEPNGRGNAGDEYYLAKKANACVVCGVTERLTKHHVVPQFYRKHFPLAVKSRSSHDILVVCVPCHVEYESTAKDMVNIIAQRTGIPMLITLEAPDRKLRTAMSAALALFNRGDVIPVDRKLQLSAVFDEFIGHPHTSEELEEFVTKNDSSRFGNGAYKSHGEAVVKKLVAEDKLNEFCADWRQHFVDVMNPKFLPIGWKVDRKVTQ